jgi:protocatechuate 3,4-dioxygenase beta subunit
MKTQIFALALVLCGGQALLPLLASPYQIQIAGPAEPGERLVLTGKVLGPDGKPRGGVEIHVWHTDAQGLYHRGPGDAPPRLQGTLRSAPDGSYTIRTIKPGHYPGHPTGAHIHLTIGGGATETLFIDGGQPLLRLTRDANGVLHGTYDFHLRGGAK